ncbi:MAG: HEPN domain-containing protein [Stygiobacter sp.]|nr:MAG: HEPN domain-containing protein [Stygiobacter sp.]KAF0213013.1 MAG: HEPN domain-containing [Ignavibacteria bacterium]
MEQQKQIEYWKKAAELDLQSAIDIYESGKNFHFSLFLCHLSIEKILKALVVKFTNDFPPKSHNLLRFAELCRIDCTDETLTLLEELSQFQLSTRYPDELFSVHKLATKEFTTNKLEEVKELSKWLTSKL